MVALRRWAQLGRSYVPGCSSPDWSAVSRLVVAAKPYLLANASDLKALLDQSCRDFGMPDPLLTDLGAHRWLEKENSYSDWLAWVLERLEPSAVFEVLGVDPPQDAGKCHIQRESQLGERYIDLLIRFDRIRDYAIVVEVKTYDEQYGKHQRYIELLKRTFGKDMPCVLVANHDRIEKTFGFKLRPWRKVAFALRSKIAEYAARQAAGDRIITAMMLAFVAAVEQNLLGLSPEAPGRVWNDKPTLISEDLVSYLRGDK